MLARPGDLVRAKRLGWNEGPTGNVTNVDILDPYDYTSDKLEGEYTQKYVSGNTVNSYVLHLVNGQPADPATVELIETR